MSLDLLTNPERIGPYRVIRPIARGGMAAVYEVEDDASGERLAVKLLNRRGLAWPRFRREYRALTRLDHPNIVRVYRFGIGDDQRPFIVMELLDGVAAQVFAKSCGRPGTPRRTTEVARLVASVADALSYLHQRGIVHRDLKSSNVIVLQDGSVKLLDFGTARLPRNTDEITRHGEFVGTFAYASPEQLKGEEVGPRSDIYSLGVLFYRLMTGKRPFEASNPHMLAKLHIEQPPRPPEHIAPGLPTELSELVLAMLAKQPEDRPIDAGAVAEALRAGRSPELSASDAVRMLSVPHLVGRDKELAACRETMRLPEPGRMLLITGVAGVGKGRLLEQLAAEARDQDWQVFEAEFPGPPGLGALGELLREAAGTLPRQAQLQAALSVLRHVPTGEMPGVGERERIFDAIGAVLDARSAHDLRPIVMVLPDLDRAPPLAMRALAELREEVVARGIALHVLSSCAEEADVPKAPIRVRFADALRIRLGPLSPREVGLLVGSMLGRRPPPARLARRIHHATGGMPGFVEEVVRSMVQAGLVEARRTDGDQVEWHDRSDGRVTIPGSVREALSLRLDSLEPDSLRVLQALTVAGGGGETEAIAHATDLPEDRVLAALHSLAALRLVDGRPEPDGARERWSFQLGLTADLVAERTRRCRRYVLERRLADAVLDAPPTLSKVRLLVAADRTELAVHDIVVLAERALHRGGADGLLPLLDTVVERAAVERVGSPSALARLHLCHARAMAQIDLADPRLEAALDQADALAPGPALGAEVDIHRAALARLGGHLRDSRELLTRAMNRLDRVAEVDLRLLALLEQAETALAAGDLAEARAACEAVLREAVLVDYAAGSSVTGTLAELGSIGMAGRARVALARVQLAAGQLTASEETVRLGLSELVEADDPFHRSAGDVVLAASLRAAGRFGEALEVLEPLLAAERTDTTPLDLAAARLEMAQLMIDLFRLGEARRHLEAFDTIEVARQVPVLRASAAATRARLRIACDEPTGTADDLSAMTTRCEELGLRPLALRLKVLLGEVAAAEGDMERAEALLDDTSRELAAEGLVVLLADACAARARALGERQVPDETFAPVAAWLDEEPARMIKLASLAASADHALAQGAHRRAFLLYDSAEALLEEIGRLLAPTDRAALRVHPWHLRIEQARSNPPDPAADGD